MRKSLRSCEFTEGARLGVSRERPRSGEMSRDVPSPPQTTPGPAMRAHGDHGHPDGDDHHRGESGIRPRWPGAASNPRSEERRVGKESRSRRSPGQEKRAEIAECGVSTAEAPASGRVVYVEVYYE